MENNTQKSNLKPKNSIWDKDQFIIINKKAITNYIPQMGVL